MTAIFDTGAAASVLRRSYAERIALPNEGDAQVRGGPSGAEVAGFRTTIRDARLGDAVFGPAMAVAFDIALPLPGVDAIISPEVFSGRLVRFDFPARVARILPQTADNIPDAPPENYVGDNTHGRMGRTPGVRVVLPNGSAVDAILDTGSRRGVTLPLELSGALPLAAPLTPAEPMQLVGTEHPAFASQLRGEVRIGQLTLVDPEVRFVDGVGRAVVGMQVLRNSIVVLDPRGHRAWVLAPEQTGVQ